MPHKISSRRNNPNSHHKRKLVVVVVSGGFDPIHPGHVRLFQEAKKLGDKLIVLINNDNWLRAKKGFTFYNQIQRAEIISGLRGVDGVRFTSHRPNTTDFSVCADLIKMKFDIFGKGGDRDKGSIPGCEVKITFAKGGKVVYNLGRGGKIASSSDLAANYFMHAKCSCGSGRIYIDCGLKKTARHKKLLSAMLNKDTYKK